jgi:hypothetical protein
MRRRLSFKDRTVRVVAVAATLAIALSFQPFNIGLAGSVQALAPVTEADGRLGLCDVLPGNTPGQNGTPWAELAYDAGARINRWEIRWDRVEPKANTWDFAANDAAVQSSQTYGIQVLGILIGTPAWAVVRGQRPGNGLPQGLYLPYNDPRNLWASYVRTTVGHYKGQVRFWEIWNEPDLSFFWTSTPDDYFRMLKVSYLVIKQVDPSARVAIAGMVVPDLSFLSHVLDDARSAPGGQQSHGYFDIAAWHAYGPAKALYANITRVKMLLQTKGFSSSPLWITEDGFPASNPNGEPRQAAYVLETVAYALAAGANKILVYRASDDSTPKTWGLLTTSGQPRMGYVSFQLAARYLAHFRAISYAPTPQLERFVFYQPDRRVTMLWNRQLADSDTDLPADSQAAKIVDWMGNVTSRSAPDGRLHLSVPGASYNAGVDAKGSVVGGPTVLVQQSNKAPDSVAPSLYVAPVTGNRRRLFILNRSDSPAEVQVAAATNPDERMAFQLGGSEVLEVDLDLLAGNDYRDMYLVSASTPVVVEAVSDETSVEGTGASRTWYLASAPGTLVLGNASDQTVRATITAFGAKGKVRLRRSVQLDATSRGAWTLPASIASMRLALTVQATGPIIVGGSGAVTDAADAWYAIRPGLSHLSVFNPDLNAPTHVDLSFVGSGTVKGLQLELSPGGSFVFPTHRAQALVLTSTHPVAVGYRGTEQHGPETISQPDTQAAVVVAGNNTHVALFNPSPQTAHVTLSLVGGVSRKQKSVALAPSQVYTLQTRKPPAPAGGVLVHSDVPIVSAPVS